MNWVHPFTLILAAVVFAFAQSISFWLHQWLSVQPDLLPALVVYAALYSSLPMTTATALVGGLCADALSAGPLGLSVLPLVAAGTLLHARREVLLRDSVWAQALLGGAASVAVPVLSLVLLYVLWPLLSEDAPVEPYLVEVQHGLTALPAVGSRMLVQIPVLGALGVLVTPLVFRLFRWIDTTFQYRPLPQTTFRKDREIQRGRS